MNKLFLSIVLLMTMNFSLTSCRETKKTESIENAVEDATKATEGALEQTGKAIDNAAEKTKEAVKASKDAIEKAGKN
jgi:hypothetical protein